MAFVLHTLSLSLSSLTPSTFIQLERSCHSNYSQFSISSHKLHFYSVTRSRPNKIMKGIVYCLFFILCFAMTHGIKCYNCNDCEKYEGSHSVQCSDSATHCLKSHSVFNKVIRECGTSETCEQKKMKTEAFKSVHCCKEDNCNNSGRAAPYWMFVSIAVVILKIFKDKAAPHYTIVYKRVQNCYVNAIF
uniref:UPAR/Ly6 domain-containing protein n=1 Tax=Strigamia maritima TaxID=126957 RepID=T1J7G8_STRMM